MPESAQPTGPPLDLEELAAFIDGRLTGERRQRVIERLADDEDAYELYDQVIRVREELAKEEAEDAPAEGRVRAFPTRLRPVVRWLPLAAGLAVAVLAGWWLLRPGPPAPMSADLLAAFDTATLTPEVAGAAPESLGSIFRGPDAEERAALFKLGVRAFDLALAAEAGDGASTAEMLQKMQQLLYSEDLLAIGLPELYERFADRLASGTVPRDLRGEIAEAEATLQADLDDPDRPHFAFGRWVEAVRTGAAEEDRTFLASSAARRPLRRFLRADPSDLVARQLAQVASGLGRGAATADVVALESAITEIQTHCADGKPCLGATTE